MTQLLQSFAKNAGLYGERVGALHVVSPSKEGAARIKSQLSVLARSEISNPPAHGARLVRPLALPAPRATVSLTDARRGTRCRADVAHPEQRGAVRRVEARHPDDGGAHHRDAQGAAPAAHRGAEDARELGPHCEPDRDVQVRARLQYGRDACRKSDRMPAGPIRLGFACGCCSRVAGAWLAREQRCKGDAEKANVPRSRNVASGSLLEHHAEERKETMIVWRLHVPCVPCGVPDEGCGSDVRRTGTLTGACLLQFHGDQPGAEPGAGGEDAHLPDAERADLDGGLE